MLKKVKGEYGYISKSKKKDVIMLLLYLAIAAAIFFAGLLLNNMSYTNIFTVVAILFVLPWARVLVDLIVFLPYKTPDEEKYQQVKDRASSEAKVLSDVVITSEEKSMGMDFMVLGNGYIYAVTANKKQDKSYIQNYLKKGVDNRSDRYQVQIFERYEEFLKKVSDAKEKELDEREKEEVEAFILSLFV